MNSESTERVSLFQNHFVPLLPLTGLVLVGMVAWLGVHLFLVLPAKARVMNLEKDWAVARERFIQHKNAKRIHQELTEVMNQFPVKEDFIPLALGITDEAKRNQVHLPSFSYRVEPATGGVASKGVFQGAVKGQYQHLRRFIHQLETADELLFIEDLDVVPSGLKSSDLVTFRMRIATYLR